MKKLLVMCGNACAKNEQKRLGNASIWVDMLTFRLRITFDEFVKLCLPARGCLGVNNTANDD